MEPILSYDFNPYADPARDARPYEPPTPRTGPINVQSEDYGVLQDLVDTLFARKETVNRLELVCLAESHDVCDDVMEVCNLMPPGDYTRPRLADQMNSIITAHGWGLTYGTVE